MWPSTGTSSAPSETRGSNSGVRAIKTATSTDFLNWTAGSYLDYEDAPWSNFYTNAITPYPRAPHIYLGFPKRFVPTRIVGKRMRRCFRTIGRNCTSPETRKGSNGTGSGPQAAGQPLESGTESPSSGCLGCGPHQQP